MTTVLTDVRGFGAAGVAGVLRVLVSGRRAPRGAHRRSDPAADAGSGDPTHPIGDPDEDDGPGYDDDEDEEEDNEDDDDEEEEPLRV